MYEYRIAEHFYSIQGEGEHVGQPQYFFRVGGCNVGKYTRVATPNSPTPFQILHPEYATCTSFNGVEFVCDTNYKATQRLTIDQIISILKDSGAKCVNLTGGEPFVERNLFDLVNTLNKQRFIVSIETSGTLPIPPTLPAYITCSPKKGYLKENTERINQFKFLVQDAKDEADVVAFLRENEVVRGTPIFIQPVDQMTGAPISIDAKASQEFTIDCVKRHAQHGWRLSMQTHKWLNVR